MAKISHAAWITILLATSNCGGFAGPEEISSHTFALSETAQQDWTGWIDGQCLHSVRAFFLQSRFGGADVGTMTRGDKDGCASLGACKTWVDDTPDKTFWNRHAMADGVQPYDVIVYQPTPSNAWGHIGSVDHLAADGTIYIVDSNWKGDEKSSLPDSHTAISLTPYGFYRLRSMEP